MTALAFVGISGVGKTRFLAGARDNAEFRHVTASELIKSGIAGGAGSQPSSEELRTGDIDSNQAILISAFTRERDCSRVPIILDGHTMIDTPTGLCPISPDIFRRLSIERMIFLQAPPEIILRQRERDSERQRPERTLKQLEDLQNQSLIAAANVVRDLEIPLSVLSARHVGEFLSLLRH